MSAMTSNLAAPNTGVFWDIEDCEIPTGLSVDDVSQNIRTALVNMGYSGKVSIEAYGHTKDHVLADFNSAGVTLHQFPPGSKSKRLKHILAHSFFWAVDNPETSNVMLIMDDISKDEALTKSLNHLRMKNYNILLGQPQNASGALLTIVSSVWLWTSLSAGGSPIDQSQHVDNTTYAGTGSPQVNTASTGIGSPQVLTLTPPSERSRRPTSE